jgi:RHS repeat-associated protein
VYFILYKKIVNSNGSSLSTYYLRDASGKELAEWDMINNSWIYYAYGRDRVAELEGSNGIRYFNYDYLGSVRVVYNVVSSCSAAPVYRLNSMSDYYAFGRTLRSFNGNKYGYQGSEKNLELGNNDYYTHFRGLDVEIGRWKGVDPVYQPSESPYVSMGNNPVTFNDVLGNTTEDWFKNLRTEEVNYLKLLKPIDEFDPVKTLYRGTTGSETNSVALFLTDDAAIAATYVKNGGKVMSYDLSQSSLFILEQAGKLNKLSGKHLIGGATSTEYKFIGKDVVNALNSIGK